MRSRPTHLWLFSSGLLCIRGVDEIAGLSHVKDGKAGRSESRKFSSVPGAEYGLGLHQYLHKQSYVPVYCAAKVITPKPLTRSFLTCRYFSAGNSSPGRSCRAAAVRFFHLGCGNVAFGSWHCPQGAFAVSSPGCGDYDRLGLGEFPTFAGCSDFR